jgi:hypothetical protein
MGKACRMHVKYEKFIHFIMKIWGEDNTQMPQEQMDYIKIIINIKGWGSSLESPGSGGVSDLH